FGSGGNLRLRTQGGSVYESHFGLRQHPFVESVNPSAYIPLHSRDAVLRRLHYAVIHRHTPAVLIGAHGSGKTLLARRLASESNALLVHLTLPALPPGDLLAHLAYEFGDGVQANLSPYAALRQLRDRLAALVNSGRRPLLIVDDAHLIQEVAT